VTTLLFRVIKRKVGMDDTGEIVIGLLCLRGWIEFVSKLCGFFDSRSRFLRLSPKFLRALLYLLVVRNELGFFFCNLGLNLIEFGLETRHLLSVPCIESLERAT